MEEIIDVPAYFFHGMERIPRAFVFMLALSTLCHMVFFAALVFKPDRAANKKLMPAVINVSMVSLPMEEAKSPTGRKFQQEPKAEKVTVSKTPKPKELVSTKPLDAVSAKPKTPSVKRSLKKKTFKPKEVVESAISRIEKDVEEKSPPPLKEALDRLKKEVGKTEVIDRLKKKVGEDEGAKGPGIPGGANISGKKILEIIDIYRIEIAYTVQKNWAFSGQLAGNDGNLQASLVFKVMSNGEIQDIFFTDRSGNEYLDESAYKAVIKSNPVDPHPAGISKPFVNVGLRFTPEGVR